LLAQTVIGVNSAAPFLLTASDTLEPLKSQAIFALPYGVSPVSDASKKTVRRRLNRGGDRAANNALRIIASSHHRIIASSHHRIIASSHHRIIASSHHRIIASSQSNI